MSIALSVTLLITTIPIFLMSQSNLKPLEIWVRGGSTMALQRRLQRADIPIKAIVVEETCTGRDDIVNAADMRTFELSSRDVAGAQVEQFMIVDATTHKNVGVKLRYTSSSGPAAQALALSLVGSVDYIMLEFVDYASSSMIPVENLVAACSKTGTKLAVCAQNPAVVPGIAFALDIGADALVLPMLSSSVEVVADGAVVADTEMKLEELWDAAAIALAQRMERLPPEESTTTEISTACLEPTPMSLVDATVTDVTYGALGDRVCIDLIRMLHDNEGILVGSSAKALCLVHGETFASEFVPPRPFRINAGPVHSYVLMADGSTKYLAELRAGDKIRVVSVDDCPRGAGVEGLKERGRAIRGYREVAIGRLKVEPRPMVQVGFAWSPLSSRTVCSKLSGALVTSGEYGKKKEEEGEGFRCGQVFLQQAETVKLFATSSRDAQIPSPGKERVDTSASLLLSTITTSVDSGISSTVDALPVTEVKVGDKLLVSFANQGTHIGKRIVAAVTEK